MRLTKKEAEKLKKEKKSITSSNIIRQEITPASKTQQLNKTLVSKKNSKDSSLKGLDPLSKNPSSTLCLNNRRQNKSHHEDDEQEAFFKWIAFAHPDIDKATFAIPNGGKRLPLEAARLKKQGVKAGVPDIFIAKPVTYKSQKEPTEITGDEGKQEILTEWKYFVYCGLFIEMKRSAESGKSSCSYPQLFFHKILTENGYMVAVCRGWQEAQKVVEHYLGLECKS